MIARLASLAMSFLAAIILVATAGQANTPGNVAQQSLVRLSMLLAADPVAAGAAAQADVQRWRNDPQARLSGQLAVAHWALANAQFRQGRSDDALITLSAAERSAPTGANGQLVRGYVALLRGVIARGNGNFGQALQHYRSAQSLFLGIADQRGGALALQSLGSLYADVGDSENAIRYLSLAQDNYAGDDAFLMSLHNNLGVALQNAERHQEAVEHFTAALQIAERRGIRAYANWIRINIASSQIQLADYQGAARVTAELGSQEALERQPWYLDLLRLNARIALNTGRPTLARQLIEVALQEIDPQQVSVANRRTHFAAYQIYRELGMARPALDQLEALRKVDEVDSGITASNRAAVIAAQFQFAAQNARIARLQADQLKRDVEYQRTVTWIIMLGSLLALGLLVSLLVLAIRSRNRAQLASTQLAEVNVRLERALAAKTEFLASTSHELRTPLNGILGMTQILLANQGVVDPVRSQIELVHDAGTTMRALVDDILDVAKIEHGGFAISPKPTDVRDLATRVVRLFEAQSQERGLTLNLDVTSLPEGLLFVDPDRITQILFNLVGNALKFTAEGRIEVGLARHIGQDGQANLQIRVSDNGIGIAPEWQEAIFDMFRQVDGARTRSHGGSGLGLAICRQLARAMGGDISVVSSEGHGSTFTVTLPWAVAADDQNTPGPCVSPSLAAGHVAIIAADPMRASMLQAIVRYGKADACIIDSSQQIAFLSSLPGVICLVDGLMLEHWLDACGSEQWSGGPVIIVGDGGNDVPESMGLEAIHVPFARSGIIEAIQSAMVGSASPVENSPLPQMVIPANADAMPTVQHKHTCAMGRR